MDVQRRKSAVAALSVLSNSTLVVLKVTVGLLIGSVSVISEAIHSGVDLVASVIALFAVRTAGKPADRRHPFGHGKVENISGLVEALLVFLAAVWIITEATRKLAVGERLEEPAWGAVVMLFSALLNAGVSRLLFKVGRETESIALQADAWHLRTDVWTSAGVMGGLALIMIGGRLLPGLNLHWIDPAAGIGVALLIIRAAWQLTLRAGRDLLDESLPVDELAWIEQHVSALPWPVHGLRDLRSRRAGPFRFIELHLVIAGETTVRESHGIADAIEKEIERRFPLAQVTIHVEPHDD